MPANMTSSKAAADFRMSAIVHAAMRSTQPCILSPLDDLSLRKGRRRGARRVLREIARPFEHLVRSWRRLSSRRMHS